MNRQLPDVPVVIPPALDGDETEFNARNEILSEIADDFNDFDRTKSDEILLDESDAAPGEQGEQREAAARRRTKLKRSILFLGVFGAAFAVFVAGICWISGVGFFAAPTPVQIDRNNAGNNSVAAPAASSDEKLKTALAMVANDANNNANAPVVTDAANNLSKSPNGDTNQLSDDKNINLNGEGAIDKAPSGNIVVAPAEKPTQTISSNSAATNQTQNAPASSIVQSPQTTFANGSTQTNEVQATNSNRAADIGNSASSNAVARSLFFGKTSAKNDSTAETATQNFSQSTERIAVSAAQNKIPAFGALLPVRLLGAVYTLRGSGGLVRMELTRAISGNGFSYPAGTVIVGNLRGSNYNRAFVGVVGLIDRESGKLVKFSGEAMGVDGASGILGERKSIKSWGSRFLRAMREAGGQAVSVLTARGASSGTIVIGGNNPIGGEASAIIRGEDNQDNGFVVVRAGTEGYILVTDLPHEADSFDESQLQGGIGNANDINQSASNINLSTAELAEILTTDDANKVRDALLKMSPESRSLAIAAMREKGR